MFWYQEHRPWAKKKIRKARSTHSGAMIDVTPYGESQTLVIQVEGYFLQLHCTSILEIHSR